MLTPDQDEFEAFEAFMQMLSEKAENMTRPRMDFVVYDKHDSAPEECDTWLLDLVIPGLRLAFEAWQQKRALLGLVREVKDTLCG